MSRFGLVCGLACLVPASLVAQRLTYEGAAALSSGRYIFTDRSTTLILSNGASFRSDLWWIRLTVPLWTQGTSLLTSTGPGPVPGGSPMGRGAITDSAASHHRRGRTPIAIPDSISGSDLVAGDPVAQLGLAFLSRPGLSVRGSVSAKIPLADTTMVGTGKWDVGFSASASIPLGGTLSLGVDGSYWHLGDMPSFDFSDPISGSLSLVMLHGRGWGSILGVTASATSLPGYTGPVSVSGGITHLWGKVSLGGYTSIGLTETAPDFSVGTAWTVRP